ncbi:2-dehydro-3-deoxyphosphogluconate aldolase/(4S)-4-hydroxy-2-oxoglutarate aldolase [Nakamurella sp. UYEF19]|uniref:bifunctional 4-hydroxy-2-oxoglutarate aldolase/2-dehydro-3-deoxy-phosphogluconate aldolase n=1 Tax=Nakamurella sp. UYEF19 TaxID=1756392 RepID=UPI00339673D4
MVEVLQSVLTRLETARIVPVVVIDDAGMAADVADALVAGGIHCAEITLRTSAGLASMAAISGRDDFTLGAGTVLTPEQVDACADAGAEFIVSPGFDESVVRRAQERGIVALPGIATATELQWALRAGLDAVKFFPADRLGGLAGISALAAPFPAVRFLPSGGVGVGNVVDYLAHPSVFAVGGSWMVPRAAIADRDFALIARLSAEAATLVR